MNNKQLYNLLKRYGITISALLILIITLSYIVIPSVRHINELSDQIFKERTKLEELYLKGQSLKRSTEEYRKIKNEISNLENIFIDPGEELSLITQLETLAQKTNVEQELNIIDTSADKMNIVLNLQGKYKNIINYLEQVEALDLYISFDRVRFSNTLQTNNKKTSQPNDPSNLTNPTIGLILNGQVNYWSNK